MCLCCIPVELSRQWVCFSRQTVQAINISINNYIQIYLLLRVGRSSSTHLGLLHRLLVSADVLVLFLCAFGLVLPAPQISAFHSYVCSIVCYTGRTWTDERTDGSTDFADIDRWRADLRSLFPHRRSSLKGCNERFWGRIQDQGLESDLDLALVDVAALPGACNQDRSIRVQPGALIARREVVTSRSARMSTWSPLLGSD